MNPPASGPAPAGPLAGIRIIDLSVMLLGPYATKVLGDLGADIVKVEPPAGDGRRTYGPRRHPDMAAQFMNVNRAKRSIVLDLKRPSGRAALLRLAAGADALVHNSRPQAMVRLGLDYAAVRQVRPDIVYCAATGFGQSGRYAAKPAYDDVIQGLSGIPALIGKVVGKPQFLPVNIADRICGVFFANALLAALLQRARTGIGQYVEVPMFESMAEFVLSEHMWSDNFDPPEPLAEGSRLFDRRPYATRDGWICVMAATDQQWAGLCRVIGRPELLDDPRFARRAVRNRNLSAVYAITESAMTERTNAQWLEAFAAADVPAAPVHTMEDLVADPHLADVGFFRTEEHPSEGRIRSMAVASSWSATPPDNRRHAPRLGEHSRELLAEAGYSGAEIDALIAEGAAVQA
jgi:crotonobetainyl-CoA:carnitine CoA-transferase CaiB-like acyl-CoA transferase